ncbi:hypothetical protein N7523_008700 [Penicillium sp. IBT 18751x]|nr:hypothetical protein N7523_008699 [Penicillium sp. IBT 18751x]KAJ6107377.1 hypothetical protein N7523_008700 [Penicillium sp. IBT 18751x]
MASLKDQDAYKFYLGKTKTNLSGLPMGNGLSSLASFSAAFQVLFQTTNKLKHHIIQKHFEKEDLILGGKGGRTSATAAIKAINNFY